mmetsp:Transcript_8958/g.28781  ORF Transcript_8958/g.28781 Transcript_8958/m.28781 type:complete len:265 (+) Transcript_8958:1534-2328(+)
MRRGRGGGGQETDWRAGSTGGSHRCRQAGEGSSKGVELLRKVVDRAREGRGGEGRGGVGLGEEMEIGSVLHLVDKRPERRLVPRRRHPAARHLAVEAAREAPAPTAPRTAAPALAAFGAPPARIARRAVLVIHREGQVLVCSVVVGAAAHRTPAIRASRTASRQQGGQPRRAAPAGRGGAPTAAAHITRVTHPPCHGHTRGSGGWRRTCTRTTAAHGVAKRYHLHHLRLGGLAVVRWVGPAARWGVGCSSVRQATELGGVVNGG